MVKVAQSSLKPGKTRHYELDLTRGIAVVVMVFVHALLVLASHEIEQSMAGIGLLLLSELAGIFVVVMGVVHELTPYRRWHSTFVRAGKLWVLALLLNAGKFTVPAYFGWLPNELIESLGVTPDAQAGATLLQMVDILHFAAVSALIMRALAAMSSAVWFPAIVAALVAGLTLVLRCDLRPLTWLHLPARLVCGSDELAYFPLLPWLVFPLMGMSLGRLLLRCGSSRAYRWMTHGGFVAFAVGLWWMHRDPQQLADFFHMRAGAILHYLGATCLALALGYHLYRFFSQSHRLFHRLVLLLCWWGKHVNALYFAQWMVIFWLIPVVGYRSLGALAWLAWSAIILLVCTVLVHFVVKPRTD